MTDTPLIRWKEATGHFGSTGENGFIGKIRAFHVGWSSVVAENRQLPHLVNSELPHLKPMRFETQDEAKSWCEKALRQWIDAAGLQVKGEEK
jgi:hypothetical protein